MNRRCKAQLSDVLAAASAPDTETLRQEAALGLLRKQADLAQRPADAFRDLQQIISRRRSGG